MKRKHIRGGGLGIRGYTIVEVLIFLAVTGGLLAAIMITISGQQSRTEFNTSVRDFENKIIDILNDVETGYSGSRGKTCTLDASGNPVESAASAELGTNKDCVFFGKAVRFAGPTVTAGDEMRVFTVAGRRAPAGVGVDPLEFATLANGNPTAYGAPETYTLPRGLEVTKVRHYQGSPVASVFDSNLSAFAMLGGIGVGVSGGNTTESTGRAQIVSLANIFNTPDDTFKAAVSNMENGVQADRGLVICLRHGSKGRIAALTVGVTIDGSGNPAPNEQRTNTETFYDNEAETKFGCTNT